MVLDLWCRKRCASLIERGVDLLLSFPILRKKTLEAVAARSFEKMNLLFFFSVLLFFLLVVGQSQPLPFGTGAVECHWFDLLGRRSALSIFGAQSVTRKIRLLEMNIEEVLVVHQPVSNGLISIEAALVTLVGFATIGSKHEHVLVSSAPQMDD